MATPSCSSSCAGRTYRQFAIYRIAEGTATEAFVTQPTPVS